MAWIEDQMQRNVPGDALQAVDSLGLVPIEDGDVSDGQEGHGFIAQRTDDAKSDGLDEVNSWGQLERGAFQQQGRSDWF